MFGDTEDMPNLTLLGMGVEPRDSTEDDWNAAAEILRKQREDGIVRQYYGQNYVSALTAGDVALTMAWSADILQLQQGRMRRSSSSWCRTRVRSCGPTASVSRSSRNTRSTR